MKWRVRLTDGTTETVEADSVQDILGFVGLAKTIEKYGFLGRKTDSSIYVAVYNPSLLVSIRLEEPIKEFPPGYN